MQNTPETVAAALDVLARQIHVPNDIPGPSGVLLEASEHVRHLAAIKAWWERYGSLEELISLMQAIPGPANQPRVR